MTLAASSLWWIAAGIAVAAELATGTFYLLMIALGLAAGAVCAQLGLGAEAQVIAAALLGGGSTGAWHLVRRRHHVTVPPEINRDVNLDIGEHVQVTAWAPDGTTRVTYRGSAWMARLAPGAAARAGEHRIHAIDGNRLVLEPLGPLAPPR